METFDFGNGSMARVLEALQSLHLPRLWRTLAYGAPLPMAHYFWVALWQGRGVMYNKLCSKLIEIS